MKTLIVSTVLSLALVAGCKKGSQCEQVVDHTLSLMPAELKDKIESGRADAVAKCEKASPEAQKCALDASSLEELMKCPKS